MDNTEKNEALAKGEEIEIAYQNKDIASKILAEEFKGKSFSVYGVDIPRIVSVEPTNLPIIEANELRMDNLFCLEDGSYLLVDYESVYHELNKVKYLNYIVRVSKRLYNELKRYPRIRMLVIYTADVKRGSTNPVMDVGSNRLEITEAFLSEMDHDEIWQRILKKVDKSGVIDSEEIMELIVYPLTFEKVEDKRIAIGRVIDLVGKIQEDNCKRFILKCLLVFTEKVILDEDVKRIKEVLMLTRVEKLIYDEARDDTQKRIAENFLRSGSDVDYVAENTGLDKDIVISIYNGITSEKK